MRQHAEVDASSPGGRVVHIEIIGSKPIPNEQVQGSSLIAEESRETRSFLAQPRITFGRSASADVEFSETEAFVSALHMVMEPTTVGYVLRDAGSRNGIFLCSRGENIRVTELMIVSGDPPVDISLGPAGPRCRICVGEAIPFSDYLVTGQLGEGGMATVFLAQEQIGLSRLVVLKLIAPSLLLNLDQKEAEKMLQEEARIASQITHPNVVNIYRAGCHEGTPFIAMEYLRGVSLNSILRQLRDAGARCPYDLAAALISQACRGLHAAHEAQDASGRSLGIVHRDFTPSNIITSPAGDVKLIDFGVARALGRNYQSASGFVGKPAYASPEQIRQPKQLTPRSDLFSAGVILHELCSGRPLFWRESDFATMAAVINDPIPVLTGLPPSMTNLLHRLLSRDPAQRPATAADLAEELEQIVLEAGGLHLQRRAIRQTLRRLQLSLQPVLPRSLSDQPQVFPQLAARRPQVPSRAPRAVARSVFSAVRSAIAPSVEQPASLEPPVSLQHAGVRPVVQLSGESYRTLHCLTQRFGSSRMPYTHGIFLAHRENAPSEEFCLHLIGGGDLTEQPSAHVRERLDSLVARWMMFSHEPCPLGELAATGEAWPGGPFALLLPQTVGDRSWGELAANPELSTAERLAWAQQLVRCLSVLTEQIPEFVHGEINATQILLRTRASGRDTKRVELRFSSRLDWLFGDVTEPIVSTAPLSIDRMPYLAPECIGGSAPSAASDVFTIAALIYELLGGDLNAAVFSIRDGGRPPPLVPSAAPAAIQDALLAAMQKDLLRRPRASELLRLFDGQPAVRPQDEGIAISAPSPGCSVSVPEIGGRSLHIQTVVIDRQGNRAPLPLPFAQVDDLLPAPVTISLFRDRLAIEIVHGTAHAAMRQHLYPRGGGCTNRLFLSEELSDFQVGSRIHHRLQRIEYRSFEHEPDKLEIPLLSHRLQLPQPGGGALLWTREQRSGDLFVCCVQIRN